MYLPTAKKHIIVFAYWWMGHLHRMKTQSCRWKKMGLKWKHGLSENGTEHLEKGWHWDGSSWFALKLLYCFDKQEIPLRCNPERNKFHQLIVFPRLYVSGRSNNRQDPAIITFLVLWQPGNEEINAWWSLQGSFMDCSITIDPLY